MGMDNFGRDGHNHNGACHCGGGYEYHDYNSKYDTGNIHHSYGRSTGNGKGLEIFIKLVFVLLTLPLANAFPVVGGILFIFAIGMLFV